MSQSFKTPKRLEIFNKYSFAVLCDELGKEKHVIWLEAKKEMMNGRIAVRPCVLGGFFYNRIMNGQLQGYNQYNDRWENTDINRYESQDELSKKHGWTDQERWLITDIIEISGGRIIR